MIGVDGFTKNVQDSIKTLGSGLELRQQGDSIELLDEWCVSIEGYLNEHWETPDPGAEIEYWKRRMQRLTSITDQLKTKHCKSVIVNLTAMTKQADERPRILSSMRRWRQIDANITKAATEAKDNAKFLATLERFLEPLQSGDPEVIIDSVPALMNAIKMIHSVSRYYNTTARVTKL